MNGSGHLFLWTFAVMSPVARMYVVGAILGVLGSTTLISTVFAADTLDGATAAPGTMYAGPGDSYPQVMRLAAGLHVALHGCQGAADTMWCDVSWRGKRGWVQANGLEVFENGARMPVPAAAVPAATFEFASYWEANYKTRLWYGDRSKWQKLTSPVVQSADASGQ